MEARGCVAALSTEEKSQSRMIPRILAEATGRTGGAIYKLKEGSVERDQEFSSYPGAGYRESREACRPRDGVARRVIEKMRRIQQRKLRKRGQGGWCSLREIGVLWLREASISRKKT